MASRAFSVGLLLAAASALLGTSTSPARGQHDAKTTSAFIQGLRDRGYHDLAADYLEQLRTRPDTPPELLETIDFELGRVLIDEAAKTGDLVHRKEVLDQARIRLDAFTKAHANHPKAAEAALQLGRLLIERASLIMIQADDTDDKAEKEARRGEARGTFDQARAAFETAEKPFAVAFEKFPISLPETDPRRTERDRAQSSMLDALLQRAVVDYEQGLTYPTGAKERTDLMSKALLEFEDLYKKHRTQYAGLAARMWQGKCYEERGGEGDLGRAIGIYNELLSHPAPQLRELQRHVGHFKIIALGKRKEYALAADEAVRWLQANNTPDLLRSKPGLGVQLELAKDVIAQLPEIKNENDHAAAVKRVSDALKSVVRTPSPFKAEALKLLKEYSPTSAASATDVARLTYDDAIAQGEQAIASHEWDRAAALLLQAIHRAEGVHDLDKTNYARYELSFADYMNKRYYEAAVLAEHLTRRYPRAGLAAKAAEIGMAALAEAYNNYVEIDRTSDLNHLIELSRYAADTFPEFEQGDSARMTLGQIYHGTGRYPQAIEAYEAVRPKSARRVEARTKAGASHWQYSQALRASGKTVEADAEVGKALAVLDEALKSRREAGAPATDPALIANACDIADIQLDTGKAAEALKLLDPIARAQATPGGPAFSRLMATLLRAHVATSQVNLAMSDMAALEKTGGGAGMTQLYVNLGKLLQKEMDALKKKGDSAGLKRTQQAYFQFLNALVASQSVQTFESLEWAGENLLNLGHAKEAEAVFHRVLDTYGKPDAKPKPLTPEQSLRARLKLAAALRDQGKHDDDKDILLVLEKEFPRSIEVIMAKAMWIEAMAQAGALARDRGYTKVAREAKTKVTPWSLVHAQWRDTALRLGNARTRPVEYYDAWYHAALALRNDGKTTEAKQTLGSILRLSRDRSVGGPEMKAKYETLLKQLE